MDLTPYINSLQEDLATTASAGDEQTRSVARVLSGALEPAIRLALMNALADLAAEVTANLEDHVVEVRLDGRDVRVVVTGTGHTEEHPGAAGRASEPPPPPPPDGGDISRLTLRLFEEIKKKAEDAASAQGVSLNTFVQQAVQSALQGKGGHSPWAQGDWGKHGGWAGGPRGGAHGKGRSGRNWMHGWVEG